jgi:hypothetical protein
LHCNFDGTTRACASDERLQVILVSVRHLWEGFDIAEPLEQHFIILWECHAHSAKFWMSANTRTLATFWW